MGHVKQSMHACMVVPGREKRSGTCFHVGGLAGRMGCSPGRQRAAHLGPPAPCQRMHGRTRRAAPPRPPPRMPAPCAPPAARTARVSAPACLRAAGAFRNGACSAHAGGRRAWRRPHSCPATVDASWPARPLTQRVVLPPLLAAHPQLVVADREEDGPVGPCEGLSGGGEASGGGAAHALGVGHISKRRQSTGGRAAAGSTSWPLSSWGPTMQHPPGRPLKPCARLQRCLQLLQVVGYVARHYYDVLLILPAAAQLLQPAGARERGLGGAAAGGAGRAGRQAWALTTACFVGSLCGGRRQPRPSWLRWAAVWSETALRGDRPGSHGLAPRTAGFMGQEGAEPRCDRGGVSTKRRSWRPGCCPCWGHSRGHTSSHAERAVPSCGSIFTPFGEALRGARPAGPPFAARCGLAEVPEALSPWPAPR